MQSKAMENLELQRNNDVKKSLLISATGTGKTFLSAFDKTIRCKSIICGHRANIARAMETFKNAFKKMYQWECIRDTEVNANFIFPQYKQ